MGTSRRRRRRNADRNRCLLALAVSCTIVGGVDGNLGPPYAYTDGWYQNMGVAQVRGGDAEALVSATTSSFVEVYENEVFDRARKEWIASSVSRWTNGDGSTSESPLSVSPPKGDRFVDDWKIDVSRDELGWEYYLWDGVGHRRRRWVRSVAPKTVEPAAKTARAKRRPSRLPSWKEAVRDNFNFKGYGVSLYKSFLSLPSFGGSLKMPLTTHFDWFDRHPWVPMLGVSMGVNHFLMSLPSKRSNSKKTLGQIVSSLFSEQERRELFTSFRRVRPTPQKSRVFVGFFNVQASIPVAVIRFVLWDIWYRISLVRYYVQRTVRAFVLVPVLTLLALPYRILLWFLIATGGEGYPQSKGKTREESGANPIGWIVRVPQPKYPSMPLGRRNLQLYATPDVSERVGVTFGWRVNSGQPGVEFRFTRWYSWLPLFVFLQDIFDKMLDRLLQRVDSAMEMETTNVANAQNSTSSVEPLLPAKAKGALSEWLRQKAGRIGLSAGYPTLHRPYFFCEALFSLSALYSVGFLRHLFSFSSSNKSGRIPSPPRISTPSASSSRPREDAPLRTSPRSALVVSETNNDHAKREEHTQDELARRRFVSQKRKQPQTSPRKKSDDEGNRVVIEGEPFIETTYLQS